MQITKGENARLRWLLKAVAKNDKRPVLQWVYVKGTTTVGLDGFRAHFIRTPVGLTLTKAPLVKLPDRILVKDTEIEVTPQEGRFPDASALVPTRHPEFSIYVNAQYLREALEGMDGAVTLCFHGPGFAIEVLGRAVDDTQVYALVMPTRKPRGISYWRPYEHKEKET